MDISVARIRVKNKKQTNKQTNKTITNKQTTIATNFGCRRLRLEFIPEGVIVES